MSKKSMTFMKRMEVAARHGAQLRSFITKVNYLAIFTLGVGLALHRYVWSDYFLDLYVGGFAALTLLVNNFATYLLLGFLELYEEYRPNTTHDEYAHEI